MKTSAYVWGALLVLNLCLFRCGFADTVVEKISNDPDLSEVNEGYLLSAFTIERLAWLCDFLLIQFN